VERSLRVLDGAVVIFDAVHGVQAQSETVWFQANRYSIPKVAYLNKMDREGASIERSVDMMIQRLDTKPFIIQIPFGVAKGFKGVIDLLTMEVLEWNSEDLGMSFTRELLEPGAPFYQQAVDARNQLIEQLAEVDDEVMEAFLDSNIGYNVPFKTLQSALRRVTIQNKGVIVLCGSSLKHKGVQPLMDAVVDYLPSPAERPPTEAFKEDNETVAMTPDPKAKLCALAFKVVHDHKRGLVVYFRVYSGTLRQGERLLNVNKRQYERPTRIARIVADNLEEINEIVAGDIGAAIGLKITSTGDTLCSAKDPPFLLKGLSIPEPVYFCSIFPESAKDEEPLKEALNFLQLEDPSFKWFVNSETGQTVICGMGELHLEIIMNKLATHYNVKATTGKLYIAYKSTILSEIEQKFSRSFTVAGKIEDVELTFNLSPRLRGSGNLYKVSQNLSSDSLSNTIKRKAEVLQAIETAVRDTFASGVPPGFPLVDVSVTLINIGTVGGASPNTFRVGAIQAIEALAKEARIQLLEPLMKVEISVDSEFLGSVLSDMSRRRGHVKQILELKMKKFVVLATIPLKELADYSTELRAQTKGKGSFTMEFEAYGELGTTEQREILREHGYINW